MFGRRECLCAMLVLWFRLQPCSLEFLGVDATSTRYATPRRGYSHAPRTKSAWGIGGQYSVLQVSPKRGIASARWVEGVAYVDETRVAKRARGEKLPVAGGDSICQFCLPRSGQYERFELFISMFGTRLVESEADLSQCCLVGRTMSAGQSE